MEYIPTVEEVSGLLGAISAFLVMLWRYKDVIAFFINAGRVFVAPIKRIVEWIKLARKLDGDSKVVRSDIEEIKKALKNIQYQLNPNGGSSLADKVARIEKHMIIREHAENALLLDSPKGIFRCDTEGSNEWVNRTYARWLGCGTNELLGLKWKRFIDTEELERYNKIWQAAFHDASEFDAVVAFRDTQGHKVNLKVSTTAIPDESGRIIGYIGQIDAL